MEFTAVSWNLFHGRDFPPDPGLFTWRSRLLRITECNATHLQVNRELGAEFASMLAAAEWDVALLQECPPRFAAPLARACQAEGHRVLTSRNSFGALRGIVARLNPDLIASGEGGSNLILVRRDSPLSCSPSAQGRAREQGKTGMVERQGMAIHEGKPERRAMAFVRTASGVCIANLHATSGIPALAAADVLRAAEAAVGWAGGSPLLFGGDLNLRPGEDPGVFEELYEHFALGETTGPKAIDHLLVRGLEVAERPTQWPPECRELRRDELALRLSDHAPVQASFSAPASG